MSTLSAIRDGLEVVLDAIAAIASASGYPTEKVGATPHAMVGFDDDAIRMGGDVETHIHTIDVSVLVGRKGMLPNELRATEDVIDAVYVGIRANQSLGGTAGIVRVVVTRTREAIIGIGNVEYVGFVATVEIKENRYVSLGG